MSGRSYQLVLLGLHSRNAESLDTTSMRRFQMKYGSLLSNISGSNQSEIEEENQLYGLKLRFSLLKFLSLDNGLSKYDLHLDRI